MTNRHFGRLSEVWKHLVFAEVLAAEQPRVVLDSHAGDALYDAVDDPERRFGVLGFDAIVEQEPTLRNSAYASVLSSLRTGPTLHGIPGGPLVAMTVLGDTAEYLFCDLDDNSAGNVREVATQRGVHSARVLIADGIAAVSKELGNHDPATVVVFIDPFDHQAVGPTGLSALDLAVMAAGSRAKLVYWYGYDAVQERHWLLHDLVERDPALELWCGDVMVSAHGEDMTAGDLGEATSPGTGFGLVCANVARTTTERCTRLGTTLAAAYQNRRLPSGNVGALNFVAIQHSSERSATPHQPHKPAL